MHNVNNKIYEKVLAHFNWCRMALKDKMIHMSDEDTNKYDWRVIGDICFDPQEPYRTFPIYCKDAIYKYSFELSSHQWEKLFEIFLQGNEHYQVYLAARQLEINTRY